MEKVGEGKGGDKIGTNTVSSCMHECSIFLKKKRKIRKFKMKVRCKSEKNISENLIKNDISKLKIIDD